MRTIIDIFTGIPPSYVQETTQSRTVIPVVIGLSALYHVAHFCLLFVLEPSEYHGAWLSLVDLVRNHLSAVDAWANTSHALRAQFPSLYVLGLVFGIPILLYVAAFSNGITLIDRRSGAGITARQFVRAALAVLVGNLLFLYVLFFWPDSGPESAPITTPGPLLSVVESRLGNQLIFPFTTVIAYYWFGANVAWLRIIMSYQYHSRRNRK